MTTKELAQVFKALSNDNRLEIYLQIVKVHEKQYETGCECFVSDIIQKFNIGAPTISHHLKELTNAKLILTEKRGKYLIAKPNGELIEEVLSIFR